MFARESADDPVRSVRDNGYEAISEMRSASNTHTEVRHLRSTEETMET